MLVEPVQEVDDILVDELFWGMKHQSSIMCYVQCFHIVVDAKACRRV